jgi:hypothetical protein
MKKVKKIEIFLHLITCIPRLKCYFVHLDQDPHSECGSGSSTSAEYGSNADPDPKPCLERPNILNLDILNCTKFKA